MTVLKNIIVSVGIILALLAIYFSAYLPFAKARLYIKVQSELPTFNTVEEIENAYNSVFNYYSPIGKEEVAKFLIEVVQSAVVAGKAPEAVQEELTAYAARHVIPTDVVQLVQIGNTYDALWREFGKQEQFDKAEEYYLKTLAIGPRLPQGLYSLFNLYGAAGDTAKLQAVGKRILAIWPNDTHVREVLAALSKNK